MPGWGSLEVKYFFVMNEHDERTELEGNDQNGNPTSHAESRHHTNQRICTHIHTHTWIHWYCCTSNIHTCRHTHPYTYSQAAFVHVRQTNMDSHEHIHTHPQINTNTCTWRHTNTTQPLPRDSETENKSFSSAVFEKNSLLRRSQGKNVYFLSGKGSALRCLSGCCDQHWRLRLCSNVLNMFLPLSTNQHCEPRISKACNAREWLVLIYCTALSIPQAGGRQASAASSIGARGLMAGQANPDALSGS